MYALSGLFSAELEEKLVARRMKRPFLTKFKFVVLLIFVCYEYRKLDIISDVWISYGNMLSRLKCEKRLCGKFGDM